MKVNKILFGRNYDGKSITEIDQKLRPMFHAYVQNKPTDGNAINFSMVNLNHNNN